MSWFDIIAPAWLAGTLLTLLSTPIGCLVLWRRMAFFSDTLAHGALLGVGVASWLSLAPDLGILVTSIIVVLILSVLEDKKLPSDALLACVAAILLCLGLLTLTQLTQQQANVLGFLFGNLLEITWQDIPKLSILIATGIGCLMMIWHKQIKLATSFELARIDGINPVIQKLFFMGLLAGFCAVALQAVGSLLISGLLILPALSARLFAHSPKMMVVVATGIGQVCVTLGIWVSVWLDIQTGLSIVLLLGLVFFGTFMLKKLGKNPH